MSGPRRFAVYAFFLVIVVVVVIVVVRKINPASVPTPSPVANTLQDEQQKTLVLAKISFATVATATDIAQSALPADLQPLIPTTIATQQVRVLRLGYEGGKSGYAITLTSAQPAKDVFRAFTSLFLPPAWKVLFGSSRDLFYLFEAQDSASQVRVSVSVVGSSAIVAVQTIAI